MEVIEQEPIQEPERATGDMVWKILTGAFVATTIIAFIVGLAIGGSGKSNSSTGDGGSSNNKGSQQSSNNSGSSSSSQSSDKDDLALKSFDVSIGGLVNGAGFNYGSILTLKTNADGTYMLGEVKSGETLGYTYRSLPSGSWKHSTLNSTGENAICEEIEEEELYAFKGVTFSGAGNVELKCSHKSTSMSGTETTTVVSLTEALDNDYYKSSN